MAACTFFGHRDCPETLKSKLREMLIDLITNHNVDMFYVGNQGRFDAIVRGVLRELKKEYPQINYAVVLAYMPGKQVEYDDYSDTMLPEGIETVHPRFAISLNTPAGMVRPDRGNGARGTREWCSLTA